MDVLYLFISKAKKMIVSAIKASIVPWGKDINSKTVRPNVILWANVKAVMVLMIFKIPEIQKSKPNINRIWSHPLNKWEKPNLK